MSALNGTLPDEARKILRTVSDEAEAVEALTAAGYALDDAQGHVRAFQAERAQRDGWHPLPVAFDFDADPDPPDWLIYRTVEHSTVVMLSGDTGSAKSIVASSLLPAALDGGDWLGKTTHIDRVTVIDEENPERLVRARLAALGITNDHRERLRYFSRAGFALCDGGRSDERLRAHLEEFGPDLVIVDTLMAACAVQDTNSNSEAVRVMKGLRELAQEFGCAFLVLHHERKQSKDHPASSGQAMMGARQWAGQADAHITLTVESDFTTETDENGVETTRRTFKIRPAEKDRDGRENGPRRVAVTSERTTEGRYAWMRVEDEGPIHDATAEDTAAAAILTALAYAETESSDRKALAAAASEKDPSNPSGTFKRALTGLIDAGKVEKVGRRYRATDEGRQAAGIAF
jgi:hypothetical protein